MTRFSPRLRSLATAFSAAALLCTLSSCGTAAYHTGRLLQIPRSILHGDAGPGPEGGSSPSALPLPDPASLPHPPLGAPPSLRVGPGDNLASGPASASGGA